MLKIKTKHALSTYLLTVKENAAPITTTPPPLRAPRIELDSSDSQTYHINKAL